MENFITRSISAIVYAGIFLFAILFSAETYIGLITLFAGICIWEFSKIINYKSYIPYLLLGLCSAFVFVERPTISKTWIILLVTLFSAVKLLIDLFSEKLTSKSKLTTLIVQIEYLVLPFFFLTLLPFLNKEYHPNLIIYIILIIWTNDSFAYIVGKNFGKRKLFERISPKKTIEGFIGGLIFSIIIGFIIGKYSALFTIGDWIIIATIVSVFGTMGDLVESKFKRQANVKDSGTIMPGHGGLLDRLDSLFFLAPFVYLYVHYFM
ncbi:phosphatidate cytidylyltransferase [Tenacibaculum sp. IB213877]|uniref:phosphatidate cytidylyltransferase n=1 Tax=Tenacibaculum sp. IB213877 TaxID=3097351 RepID=UPI002A5A24E5|nr:phosphatidate cytidylyltransferase [Tenacibaculum sp. IB213877]MDY0781127.1 phosphatidate cytidylyltransferase [Tenacibaculum sp. IB213877]